MIKVVLVDDHYPVIDFLSKSVPWQELGMQVIATCGDGREALEVCERDMPDILITDIGMPRMDGLQLIDEVRKAEPELAVVILSCHDEFVYAQKAMKAGVKDYLLKESLQPEELTLILKQLTQAIEARVTERLKNDQLARVLDQNTASIKSDFIRHFIKNPIMNDQQCLAELRRFGLKQAADGFLPVLIYPNAYLELKRRFQTEELLTYALDNVVAEFVDHTGMGVSFRYSPSQTFLLFPFVKSLKVNSYEITRGKLTELLRLFERIGITVSAMTYEPTTDIVELKRSMLKLLSAKDQRFYASAGTIYKWVDYQTSSEDLFAHYQRAIDEFQKFIAQESTDDSAMFIKEWMQFLKDQRFPAEAVRSWVMKLVMDIDLKYSSLQHFHSGPAAEPIHQALAQMETIHEIEPFIQAFVQAKIQLTGQIKMSSQRPQIHEAKKYVTSRLHEKISMEEVAVMLDMNPSHFSRIFKNETGETFIEYVTRVKMEKAKEKLDHTDSTVERIAESLGYENTSYFIKLFKAYTGYSPKDYRLMKA
jgi:two-component system, response regulator YesN